jgi:hypothetical protein
MLSAVGTQVGQAAQPPLIRADCPVRHRDLRHLSENARVRPGARLRSWPSRPWRTPGQRRRGEWSRAAPRRWLGVPPQRRHWYRIAGSCARPAPRRVRSPWFLSAREVNGSSRPRLGPATTSLADRSRARVYRALTPVTLLLVDERSVALAWPTLAMFTSHYPRKGSEVPGRKILHRVSVYQEGPPPSSTGNGDPPGNPCASPGRLVRECRTS